MQVKVNVDVVVRFACACEPFTGLAPLHAPDAVQAVALVEDQLSVDEPPLTTVVGDALNVTDGSGGAVTVTVTDCVAEPPAPLQDRAKDVLAVSTPVDTEPEVALFPLQPPEAVQKVALVDDQLSVDEPPLAIVVGVAVSVTDGAANCVTVTLTD